ncbi:hypothetical protein HK405_008555, partial [Cladochytrium tenue]
SLEADALVLMAASVPDATPDASATTGDRLQGLLRLAATIDRDSRALSPTIDGAAPTTPAQLSASLQSPPPAAVTISALDAAVQRIELALGSLPHLTGIDTPNGLAKIDAVAHRLAAAVDSLTPALLASGNARDVPVQAPAALVDLATRFETLAKLAASSPEDRPAVVADADFQRIVDDHLVLSYRIEAATARRDVAAAVAQVQQQSVVDSHLALSDRLEAATLRRDAARAVLALPNTLALGANSAQATVDDHLALSYRIEAVTLRGVAAGAVLPRTNLRDPGPNPAQRVVDDQLAFSYRLEAETLRKDSSDGPQRIIDDHLALSYRVEAETLRRDAYQSIKNQPMRTARVVANARAVEERPVPVHSIPPFDAGQKTIDDHLALSYRLEAETLRKSHQWGHDDRLARKVTLEPASDTTQKAVDDHLSLSYRLELDTLHRDARTLRFAADAQRTIDDHLSLSYRLELATLTRDAAMSTHSASLPAAPLPDLFQRVVDDHLALSYRLELLTLQRDTASQKTVDDHVALSNDLKTQMLQGAVASPDPRHLERDAGIHEQMALSRLGDGGQATVDNQLTLSYRLEAETLRRDAKLNLASGGSSRSLRLSHAQATVEDHLALSYQLELATLRRDVNRAVSDDPLASRLLLPASDLAPRSVLNTLPSPYQEEVDNHLDLSYRLELATLRRDAGHSDTAILPRHSSIDQKTVDDHLALSYRLELETVRMDLSRFEPALRPQHLKIEQKTVDDHLALSYSLELATLHRDIAARAGGISSMGSRHLVPVADQAVVDAHLALSYHLEYETARRDARIPTDRRSSSPPFTAAAVDQATVTDHLALSYRLEAETLRRDAARAAEFETRRSGSEQSTVDNHLALSFRLEAATLQRDRFQLGGEKNNRHLASPTTPFAGKDQATVADHLALSYRLEAETLRRDSARIIESWLGRSSSALSSAQNVVDEHLAFSYRLEAATLQRDRDLLAQESHPAMSPMTLKIHATRDVPAARDVPLGPSIRASRGVEVQDLSSSGAGSNEQMTVDRHLALSYGLELATLRRDVQGLAEATSAVATRNARASDASTNVLAFASDPQNVVDSHLALSFRIELATLRRDADRLTAAHAATLRSPPPPFLPGDVGTASQRTVDEHLALSYRIEASTRQLSADLAQRSDSTEPAIPALAWPATDRAAWQAVVDAHLALSYRAEAATLRRDALLLGHAASFPAPARPSVRSREGASAPPTSPVVPTQFPTAAVSRDVPDPTIIHSLPISYNQIETDALEGEHAQIHVAAAARRELTPSLADRHLALSHRIEAASQRRDALLRAGSWRPTAGHVLGDAGSAQAVVDAHLAASYRIEAETLRRQLLAAADVPVRGQPLGVAQLEPPGAIMSDPTTDAQRVVDLHLALSYRIEAETVRKDTAGGSSLREDIAGRQNPDGSLSFSHFAVNESPSSAYNASRGFSVSDRHVGLVSSDAPLTTVQSAQSVVDQHLIQSYRIEAMTWRASALRESAPISLPNSSARDYRIDNQHVVDSHLALSYCVEAETRRRDTEPISSLDAPRLPSLSLQSVVDEHLLLSYRIEAETVRRDEQSSFKVPAPSFGTMLAGGQTSAPSSAQDIELQMERSAMSLAQKTVDDHLALSYRLELASLREDALRNSKISLRSGPAVLDQHTVDTQLALSYRVEAETLKRDLKTALDASAAQHLIDMHLALSYLIETQALKREVAEFTDDTNAQSVVDAHLAKSYQLESVFLNRSLLDAVRTAAETKRDDEAQQIVNSHLLMSYVLEAHTTRRELASALEFMTAPLDLITPDRSHQSGLRSDTRGFAASTPVSRHNSPERIHRPSPVFPDDAQSHASVTHRHSEGSIDETVVEHPEGKVLVDSSFLRLLMLELDGFRSRDKTSIVGTERTPSPGSTRFIPDISLEIDSGRNPARTDPQLVVDQHLLMSFAHDLASMSAACIAVKRELRKKRQSIDLSEIDIEKSLPDNKTLPELVSYHMSFLRSYLEKAHTLEMRLADSEARLRARDAYLQNTIMDTARRVQELEQLTADLEAQNDELRLELRRAREDKELLAQELGDLEEDHLALQNEIVIGEAVVASRSSVLLANGMDDLSAIGADSASPASGDGEEPENGPQNLMDDYVLLRDVETQTDASGIVSVLGGAPAAAAVPSFSSAAEAISAINGVRGSQGPTMTSQPPLANTEKKITRDASTEARPDGDEAKALSLSNRLVYATLIATTQAETIAELQRLVGQKDAALDRASARLIELELRATASAAEAAGHLRRLAEIRENLATLERERAEDHLKRILDVPAPRSRSSLMTSSVATQTAPLPSDAGGAAAVSTTPAEPNMGVHQPAPVFEPALATSPRRASRQLQTASPQSMRRPSLTGSVRASGDVVDDFATLYSSSSPLPATASPAPLSRSMSPSAMLHRSEHPSRKMSSHSSASTPATPAAKRLSGLSQLPASGVIPVSPQPTAASRTSSTSHTASSSSLGRPAAASASSKNTGNPFASSPAAAAATPITFPKRLSSRAPFNPFDSPPAAAERSAATAAIDFAAPHHSNLEQQLQQQEQLAGLQMRHHARMVQLQAQQQKLIDHMVTQAARRTISPISAPPADDPTPSTFATPVSGAATPAQPYPPVAGSVVWPPLLSPTASAGSVSATSPPPPSLPPPTTALPPTPVAVASANAFTFTPSRQPYPLLVGNRGGSANPFASPPGAYRS